VAFDPEVPYNVLPRLPLAKDVESKEVLRQTARAHRLLGALKGYCASLPNAGLLVDSLILQEARSSSAVENIVTTQDLIYQAALSSAHADPAAKEVVDYRAALWAGYKLLRGQGGISVQSILMIQETLVHNNAGVRALPGTVLRNEASGRTVYTPPVGRDLILDLLANLERYLSTADSTDPLVRMAVAHHQFESIHPFYDGNGRTGRILNILYLVHAGLLDLPVLYLSRQIIQRKDDYYRLLQAARVDGAWEEWVLFLLQAVEVTSQHTLTLMTAIRDLLESTVELCRARLPRTTYSRELVERLFVQPYVKTEHLVKAGIAERRTATKYLRQIEEIGVLKSFKVWKETIFVNRALYDLLQEP
jgi:Fic family protein